MKFFHPFSGVFSAQNHTKQHQIYQHAFCYRRHSELIHPHQFRKIQGRCDFRQNGTCLYMDQIVKKSISRRNTVGSEVNPCNVDEGKCCHPFQGRMNILQPTAKQPVQYTCQTMYPPHRIKVQLAPCHRPLNRYTIKILA